MQGPINNLNYNIGLYYDNQLVSCMSFGKPRFNKKYEWELLRFANKANYKVIGGASRIFKYFINKECPNNIISYCDLDKMSGKIYLTLGFKLNEITAPTFEWTDYIYRYNWKVVLDKGPDQILGTKYGKRTNNEDIMINEGFVKVYNSGNKVYLYERQ